MRESTTSAPQPDELASSLAALEREQLLSYVDWAEVEVPWWYLPVYGTSLAAFIAAYSLGVWWGTVGALAFAATMGGLVRVATSRSGVSMPRFRAMPSRLRVTFLPIAVAGLATMGTLAGGLLVAQDPPFVVLGLVIGAGAAVAGWVHTVWYRAEARRLAREHGLQR